MDKRIVRISEVDLKILNCEVYICLQVMVFVSYVKTSRLSNVPPPLCIRDEIKELMKLNNENNVPSGYSTNVS